ncbi:hypothetical protein ASG87_02785 [Frateuria sp. Soil773]|uniref:hypothetical protein n=1 Tax=Frateuria sp. Soil773 TaxID=1736407 RepID=UPI0006F2505E|nr:hypothetical protein [Frateuria sp. Soil773]KRE89287.1 hypothetical protein ASG87_02785 [Frateuria sp. Soil773]
MNSNAREAVLKRAAPGWYGQFQPQLVAERGWAKLSPDVVVGLLEGASHNAHHRARLLLGEMQSQSWRILATVHSGGKGDEARAADTVPRITLQVGNRKYHLRCKAAPQLHVVAITA